MRKIEKILELNKDRIAFEKESPLQIRICRCSHSDVQCHLNALEIVLCLEGEVNIRCNHEQLRLSAGEIYTIDQKDIHCLWSDAENIIAVIHINTESDQISTTGLSSSYIACEDLSCQPFQRGQIKQIKSMLLALIYRQCFETLDQQTLLHGTDKIAAILMQYFNWFNLRDNYPAANPEVYDRMLYVMDYCETHYMEKLTISSLAESIHISQNYFSQFFKHCPYGSFSLMIGYVRCYYAQELLLSTRLPIIEVSQMCGFSDVKYMYKNFRYWWKQTPKEYRQWYEAYIHEPIRESFLTVDETKRIIEPYAARIFSELVL